MSWSPVPAASSYVLYWSTTAGGTAAGERIPGVASPYTHMGRSNGTRYYYTVAAMTNQGESPKSAEVSGTPQGSGLDVGQFDGTYSGSWTQACPACSDTTTAGTFKAVLVHGTFTQISLPITSGTHGPRLDSATVAATGDVTGNSSTPPSCSASATVFAGHITTLPSGAAQLTMTFSRPASSGGCEAETGLITAARSN